MVTLALLAAGGCAPTQLGENYGTAYYTMIEGQTLDPTAGQSLDPVFGLDGHAAATAMEQYRKSFENPDANLTRSLISSGVQTK
jgi:predicted Zn-dependent protease